MLMVDGLPVASTPPCGTKRRRIHVKKPSVHVPPSPILGAVPSLSFLEHPCYLAFLQLEVAEQNKQKRNLRQGRNRMIETLKKGEIVKFNGVRYTWPEQESQQPLVMDSVIKGYYLNIAESVEGCMVKRGAAMDYLMTKLFNPYLEHDEKQLEHAVVKCRSVLLTYQGRWGQLFDVAPDDNLSIADLSALLQNHSQARESFQEAVQLFDRLREQKHVQHYVVSQELCKETWTKQKKARVHTHVWVLKPAKINTLSFDALRFKNATPHLNLSAAEIGMHFWSLDLRQSPSRSHAGEVTRS